MAAISDDVTQKCIDACLKGMTLKTAVDKFNVDVPRQANVTLAKAPAYRKLRRKIQKLKQEKRLRAGECT